MRFLIAALASLVLASPAVADDGAFQMLLAQANGSDAFTRLDKAQRGLAMKNAATLFYVDKCKGMALSPNSTAYGSYLLDDDGKIPRIAQAEWMLIGIFYGNTATWNNTRMCSVASEIIAGRRE